MTVTVPVTVSKAVPPKRLIRVLVEREICVGSGMCASGHPQLFQVTPAGYATYIGAQLDEAAALSAAELCPVSAISLIYED